MKKIAKFLSAALLALGLGIGTVHAQENGSRDEARAMPAASE
jgi:hypothetical protein